MQFNSLCVLHQLKSKTAIPFDLNSPELFSIDTCQRRVWVGHRDFTSFFENDPRVLSDNAGLPDIYFGQRAYLFLLRLASGLESAVVGETDIFGQIKSFWTSYEYKKRAYSKALSPWMQRLFEDCKEIRSQYLQGIGGASYGTLVRKLLPDNSPVLVIGAGQIAQAVVPYLQSRELILWNRTSEKAFDLSAQIQAAHPAQSVRIISQQEDLFSAWAETESVIFCIPPEKTPYDFASKWLKASRSKSGPVIHLGYLHKKEAGVDPRNWMNFFCLEDLFQLQEIQNDVRAAQIQRAAKACEERSLLRSLGESTSTPHGWEDLGAFL